MNFQTSLRYSAAETKRREWLAPAPHHKAGQEVAKTRDDIEKTVPSLRLPTTAAHGAESGLATPPSEILRTVSDLQKQLHDLQDVVRVLSASPSAPAPLQHAVPECASTEAEAVQPMLAKSPSEEALLHLYRQRRGQKQASGANADCSRIRSSSPLGVRQESDRVLATSGGQNQHRDLMPQRSRCSDEHSPRQRQAMQQQEPGNNLRRPSQHGSHRGQDRRHHNVDVSSRTFGQTQVAEAPSSPWKALCQRFCYGEWPRHRLADKRGMILNEVAFQIRAALVARFGALEVAAVKAALELRLCSEKQVDENIEAVLQEMLGSRAHSDGLLLASSAPVDALAATLPSVRFALAQFVEVLVDVFPLLPSHHMATQIFHFLDFEQNGSVELTALYELEHFATIVDANALSSARSLSPRSGRESCLSARDTQPSKVSDKINIGGAKLEAEHHLAFTSMLRADEPPSGRCAVEGVMSARQDGSHGGSVAADKGGRPIYTGTAGTPRESVMAAERNASPANRRSGSATASRGRRANATRASKSCETDDPHVPPCSGGSVPPFVAKRAASHAHDNQARRRSSLRSLMDFAANVQSHHIGEPSSTGASSVHEEEPQREPPLTPRVRADHQEHQRSASSPQDSETTTPERPDTARQPSPSPIPARIERLAEGGKCGSELVAQKARAEAVLAACRAAEIAAKSSAHMAVFSETRPQLPASFAAASTHTCFHSPAMFGGGPGQARQSPRTGASPPRTSSVIRQLGSARVPLSKGSAQMRSHENLPLAGPSRISNLRNLGARESPRLLRPTSPGMVRMVAQPPMVPNKAMQRSPPR